MKTFSLAFLFLALMSGQIVGQDWPNLNKFAQQNLELPVLKAGEKRIVFMGNSITEGWLQDSLDFFDNPSYVNRGIGGQTTPQMLLRFRQDVIDLKPTAVVILAGINDIAGNTGPSSLEMVMNNLISMCELAMANEINVILCSVLPAADFPWRRGLEPADKVIELNRRIRAYANDNDFIYVDYFSAMVDDQNGLQSRYTYDGVHPNTAGYKVMEPIIQKAIDKVLSGK